MLWLLLIILDQLTKFIFTGRTYLLFDNVGIHYLENTGGLFGFGKGLNVLFIIVNAIVLIAVIYFYKKELKYRLPLTLLISGTASNLIDRICFGYVRDFIAISVWPTFNLADAYNTIGLIILILKHLKR